jgi:flagellin-like protein
MGDRVKKGISPLIAEVLLIGFTIAVAAIVILWATGFTRTSTKTIGTQAETQIACTYAGIDFYGSVTYNSTSKLLFGYLRNTGNVPLGNISFQILYNNGTETRNLLIDVLLPSNLASFYFDNIQPNINLIYVSTNCTNPPITAKISSNEINFVS